MSFRILSSRALFALASTLPLVAQDDSGFSAVQQRGFDFLLKNQDDGKFFMQMPGRGGGAPQKFYDAGLTGLALAALQSKPVDQRSEAEQQVIDAGLAWLVKQQGKDGSFGQRTVVYSTSSAVFGLSRAGRKDFEPAIAKARRLLIGLQNAEARGYKNGDVDYGSYGYGNNERGDLSNTNFAIQALREAGVDAQDEALVKAVSFLQQLQNLKSVNTFEGTAKGDDGEEVRIVSGDDGGATYYPGDSPAGFDEVTGGAKYPRSYGSMTYALLKTYTLCGIEKDDTRVRAAIDWITSNWTVDYNPGSHPSLGEKARYQGLYYYYMVMAQALDMVGIDTMEVGGKKIDWRRDLHAQLGELQSDDGSWLNAKNGRWYENLDVVCTAYAMLALAHCGDS